MANSSGCEMFEVIYDASHMTNMIWTYFEPLCQWCKADGDLNSNPAELDISFPESSKWAIVVTVSCLRSVMMVVT